MLLTNSDVFFLLIFVDLFLFQKRFITRLAVARKYFHYFADRNVARNETCILSMCVIGDRSVVVRLSVTRRVLF